MGRTRQMPRTDNQFAAGSMTRARGFHAQAGEPLFEPSRREGDGSEQGQHWPEHGAGTAIAKDDGS